LEIMVVANVRLIDRSVDPEVVWAAYRAAGVL
jgi:hypothetical protein